MAFALLDAYVLVNAVNMSTWCRSVSLPFESEDLDATTMGNTFRVRIGGLKDGSVDVTFVNSFAAAEVDPLLWPLWNTLVAVEVRPTSAARSATNPAFLGNVLVNQVNPLDGGVGDLAERQISWPTSGTWTRAIA
jgi:hypothetical protein